MEIGFRERFAIRKAIAFHSGCGHAKRMARTVWGGAGDSRLSNGGLVIRVRRYLFLRSFPVSGGFRGSPRVSGNGGLMQICICIFARYIGVLPYMALRF